MTRAVQVKARDVDGRLCFVVMAMAADGEFYEVEWAPNAQASRVHEAIAVALGSLEADDPLVPGLLRADDARSAFVALFRWARALAACRGFDDPGGYARAMVRSGQW